MIDISVLAILLAVLLGGLVAVIAMALGLWFAGKLTGMFGPAVVSGPGLAVSAVPGREADRAAENVPEPVPWLGGDQLPDEGADPGEDPEAWVPA